MDWDKEWQHVGYFNHENRGWQGGRENQVLAEFNDLRRFRKRLNRQQRRIHREYHGYGGVYEDPEFLNAVQYAADEAELGQDMEVNPGQYAEMARVLDEEERRYNINRRAARALRRVRQRRAQWRNWEYRQRQRRRVQVIIDRINQRQREEQRFENLWRNRVDEMKAERRAWYWNNLDILDDWYQDPDNLEDELDQLAQGWEREAKAWARHQLRAGRA